MPNVNEQTIWSYLQFKKNYKVNEQIHELETLISEAQNHIEKLSTSLIPENNTKWLEIKHYFDWKVMLGFVVKFSSFYVKL